MRRWMDDAASSLRLLGTRRYGALFVLGFASGLPLALTGSTLAWWLSTQGVSLQSIGLFSLVSLPYAIKFLWAPFFDAHGASLRMKRRGLILVSQWALLPAIVLMGFQNPSEQPLMLALLALLVSFFSASQDIAIDGYRIALLPPSEQGVGAAVLQMGYRLGLLMAGAGALALSEWMSWQMVYGVMAACLLPCMVMTICAPTERPLKVKVASKGLVFWLDCLRTLLMKEKMLWFVLFIPLYKLGDAVAGVMTLPFYYALSFSASEVALVSKVVGTGAVIAGTIAGAFMSYHWSLGRALLVAGILQLLSNFAFVWLYGAGHDVTVLFWVVMIENVTGGMGSAVFVAFLSRLCDVSLAASHYALLSSLAMVGRSVLASGSGYVASWVAWDTFFIVSAVAALPALFIVYYLRSIPLLRK